MNIKTILILYSLLISCSSSEGYQLKISPIEPHTNSITLSELADDIMYVPLDNIFPVGLIYSMRILPGSIYLSIKDIGIVRFDRKGRYINNIGRKGRGPGEYRYGLHFTVDDENRRVYIVDNEKIKVYSSSGRFVRDFQYNRYISHSANGIELLNTLLFLPDYLLEKDPLYSWILIDTLGKVVSVKVNSAPVFYPNMGILGSTYKFDNKVFYFNLFNDTIFSVSENFVGKAAYYFSADARRRPVGGFSSDPWSELSGLFIVTKMFESNRYIFLENAYRNNGVIQIINKSTDEIFLAYREYNTGLEVNTRAFIQNDIDGGVPFSLGPVYYYFSENSSEYICSLLNSIDIIKHISEKEFRDADAKYPGKKMELERLASSLKETDNPVLIIVRLKND